MYVTKHVLFYFELKIIEIGLIYPRKFSWFRSILNYVMNLIYGINVHSKFHIDRKLQL